MRHQITELSTEKKTKLRDVLPFANAKAGGPAMIFEYNKGYAYLCGYSHNGISGVLEKYLDECAPRDYRLVIGPTFEDTPVTCSVAIDYVLTATEMLNREYKLCQSAPIAKFRQRLRESR